MIPQYRSLLLAVVPTILLSASYVTAVQAAFVFPETFDATTARAGFQAIAPQQTETFMAENRNSKIVFGSSQLRLLDWVVDGVDHLASEWFWYRKIGVQDSESDLSSLVLVRGTMNQNMINLQYLDPSPIGGFRVELNYMLEGFEAKSGKSKIVETIKITNIRDRPLALAWFAYTDLDLNHSAINDTARGSQAGITQTKGPKMTTATVTPAPGADAFQIASSQDLRPLLDDNMVTNLDNTGSGTTPADTVFAFQWNRTIDANGMFLITMEKRIDAVVPEPSSIILVSIGIATLLGVNRCRLKGNQKTRRPSPVLHALP